ncbi:MAG: UDP-glucose 4-epimerase GalE [Rhabdochlamydiaceae bacterium]|nr:UDP-glucose 4-epimerase GalE [Rhabdochlamydiaceae bacterium]
MNKKIQIFFRIFIAVPFLVFSQTSQTNEPVITSTKTVLVVGGAGFIGSHVNKLLYQNGYETIVFDNLSRGNKDAVKYGKFIEGDLGDIQALKQVFENNNIDVVMHFAAFTDVGDSCLNPGAYYINNVANSVNLLQVMAQHSVKIFIFSSTAAIFGPPEEIPITENHPYHPISPYGRSKLMVEQILADFDIAHGIKYCSFRYFNAAGGDPDNILKNYKSKENNLIPLALRSLQEPQKCITIFGTDYSTPDGTGIRDYIHVYDLASAHILAMEKLLGGSTSSSYNLGNGKGYSVLEVIKAIEKITGQQINLIYGERRQGDVPYILASSEKAKNELGWEPQYSSLETMIEHAWKALN